MSGSGCGVLLYSFRWCRERESKEKVILRDTVFIAVEREKEGGERKKSKIMFGN